MAVKQKLCVTPKNLFGYRKATSQEHEKICPVILRELAQRRRELKMFSALYGCIALGFCLSMTKHIADKSLPPGGQLALEALMFLWIAILWSLLWNVRKNRKIQNCFRDGSYEVMDCQIKEVHTNLRDVSKGAIRVMDLKDQICTDGYAIDVETAKAWQHGETIHPLLILQRDYDYSRVLTKRMMEE